VQPKHWTVFILLGAIWSASFLWIKIALAEVGPLTLVAFRVLFGLLTGLAVSAILRIPLPRDWKTWRIFILLGVINVAIPFFLITWGEQSIDSAVASILNATVPLFTVVLAHFFLHDDKITIPKIAGLLMGFLGVVLLLSKDLSADAHNSVIGQAAVILAASTPVATQQMCRVRPAACYPCSAPLRSCGPSPRWPNPRSKSRNCP
jgi:drug/metabolite transporter (DMT)-like permease